MILPDDYLSGVSDAVHSYGGIFVLDSIASGNMWVDMKARGVDVLISAPQKGWTGPACCGLVMLSERAANIVREAPTPSSSLDPPVHNSFCCNLKAWLEVMDEYVSGKVGFKYV